MLKGRVAQRDQDMNTVGEKGVKGSESAVKKGKQWNTSESRAGERAGGGSARLHFRLRSAELKGGPCTNETQFHATLSLPVLFPGFHFH